MIKTLMSLEMHSQLRSVFLWITTLVMIGLSFAFGSVPEMSAEILGSNINMHSWYASGYLVSMVTGMFSFALVPLAANAILKEREYNAVQMMFSYPITAKQVFLSRLIVLFAAGSLILFLSMVALLIGTFMPWLEDTSQHSFNLLPWIGSFFALALPTLLFTLAIATLTALVTRSNLATYLVLITLVMAQSAGSVWLIDAELDFLAAISDYSGAAVLEVVARYWTEFDKNNGNFLAHSWFWANRALWSVILITLMFTAFRFFTLQRLDSHSNERDDRSEAPVSNWKNAKLTQSGWRYGWAQISSELWLDVRLLILRRSFALFLLFIALFAAIFIFQPSIMFGTKLLPYSDKMFQILTASSLFPLMIMVVLYSSELLWREKLNNVWQYAQTNASKPLLRVITKSLVMLIVIELFMLILFVCAVALQLFLSDEQSGYNFDWSVYLLGFFVFTALKLWLTANFTLLLQIVTRQRFVAMALAIGVPIAWNLIPWIKELLFFGALPNMQYSMINGWALNQTGWLVYLAMWVPFVMAAWLVASWVWPNQQLDGIKAYVQQLGLGFKRQGLLLAIPLVIFSALAVYNYQHEAKFDNHLTGDDITELRANYEKKFSPFEDAAFPNVTHWQLNADFYPEQNFWRSQGEITLENQQDEPMSEFYIHWADSKYEVEFHLKDANIDLQNQHLALAHISLTQPLAVGEKRALGFEFVSTKAHRSFQGRTNFYQTGAFLRSQEFTPQMGINTQMYLRDNETREEEGLPKRKEIAKVKDPHAATQHAFGSNDHLTSDFTISVPATQTALAPGVLNKEWQQDGRNYFNFVQSTPILPFMNITAGEHEIMRDTWISPDGQSVALSIYHHKTHDKNLDTMMQSMHDSLTYYSEQFGPYPLPYLRVIEFPYGALAQSFSGTIPFSENMGFIADSRDEKGLDYAFYITAHEIAHQWFGHQIIPANAEGNRAIMESLAEYAAIKVLEHQRGKLHMQRLLKYDQDQYLLARTMQKHEEILNTTHEQSHVYYQKGSVMLSMLAFIIGEEHFNQAMRNLLTDFTDAQGAPLQGDYALVTDLKKALKDAIPADKKHYKRLVNQIFGQRLIFDLQMQQATATELENGDWQIDMTLLAKKYFANNQGEEREKTFNSPIEIGFFSQKPSDVANNSKDEDYLIDVQRIELNTNKNDANTQLTLIVKEKPKFVAIDPWYRFIDKDLTNNYKSVK